MGLIWQRPLSVNALARQMRVTAKEIAGDLRHLEKSLKHTDCRLVVEPAFCRKCEFEFARDKLTKPSRCPKCRSNRIEEPVISVIGPTMPPSVEKTESAGGKS